MFPDDEKLVSVIIPTYNSSSYITRSLESVLEQSYSNIEIIIVDDCSRDNVDLKEICENFFLTHNFDKYQLFLSKEKVYGCGARNIGVNIASGYYVSFLDSGDVFFSTKLSKQVKAHQLSDDSTVIYSQVYRGINIDSSEIMPVRSLEYGEHISEYIFSDGLIQTSTLFLTKDLFQKIKFTEGLKRHQDYDLCLKIYNENISFEMISEPLVHWVLEPDFNTNAKGESYEFCSNWISNYRNLCSQKGLICYTARPLLSNAIHGGSLLNYFKDIYILFGLKYSFLNFFSILKFAFLKVI